MIYNLPYPPIDGFIEAPELGVLFKWAAQYETVVEVGSWKGKSTHALLSAGPHVIAVDHFRGSPSELNCQHAEALKNNIFLQFINNLYHFSNLSILRMDSVKASKLFAPKSIDMVFIDGEHTQEAATADLLAWAPICKHFLCGHDSTLLGVFTALKDLGVKYEVAEGTRLWYCTEENLNFKGDSVQ